LLLVLSLVACKSFISKIDEIVTPEPSLPPTLTLPATLTMTPTFTPTATFTPPPTPTFTSTSTPFLYALQKTALPPSFAPINVNNATQVSGLAEWKVDSIADFAWTSGGMAFTVATLNDIRLYDIYTREILRTLYPVNEGIVSIAFSPDGQWLVSGSRRGSQGEGFTTSLERWIGPDWKPLGIYYGVPRAVNDMVFSPNSKIFMTAYASSVYEANSVDFVETFTWSITNTLSTGTVLDIAISPDGGLLATTPDRYAIKIWDLGVSEWLFTLYTSFTGAVNTIQFSPNGRLLASGHYDSVINLWDLTSGELFRTITTETVVQSLAFSPDGRILASGSSFENGLIRLWSVETGELLQTLAGHKTGVEHLIFSPDSKFLMSGSYDGIIRMWGIRP
jgi:WD40 repeat protein